MIAESFVDTNVLIYAAVGKNEQPEKHKRAWEIIGPARYGLSGQVLAEFFVNATRKTQVPLSMAEATNWIDRLKLLPLVPVDADLVCEAIRYSGRYQISYWDAALIAAAERLDADTLYTEDLNHGQTYGSVKAINPFMAA